MDKSAIRTELLQRRKLVTDLERTTKSTAIAALLSTRMDWSLVRRVHVYWSNRTWGEIDTSGIGSYISSHWHGIQVDFGEASKHAIIPTDFYDVIIIPIVAFDTNLNRTGFGGGWYDKFLAMQPDALKIGIAYEFQRVSNVSIEPHDVRLDMVITETTVYE